MYVSWNHVFHNCEVVSCLIAVLFNFNLTLTLTLLVLLITLVTSVLYLFYACFNRAKSNLFKI